MKKIPLAQQLSPLDLDRSIASVTGLHIMLRMIAENVGVHPAVVYAMSVSCGQKIFASQNQEELNRLVPGMIREFSDAIQAARTSRYSPAIENAVNYLTLHISQKVDMKELSALAECTPDNLSQRFKQETGFTVAQYVTGSAGARQSGLTAGKWLLGRFNPAGNIIRAWGSGNEEMALSKMDPKMHLAGVMPRPRVG